MIKLPYPTERVLIILGIWLTFLFLTACSTSAPSTQQINLPVVQGPTSGETPAYETDQPAEAYPPAPTSAPQALLEGAADSQAAYPAPEEALTLSEAAKPTPRPDLEATDPTSINLASGEVQLVEFFAFW